MYDHEPSSLKLIRIGASAASTNAKRMLATSSQPCATASTLRLLTASPSRNRQAIVEPGFHSVWVMSAIRVPAEAPRTAIERDGHQVVRAFGQRARLGGRPLVVRHEPVDAHPDLVVSLRRAHIDPPLLSSLSGSAAARGTD